MYLWPWSLFSHQKWNNYISQIGQPANLCYIVHHFCFSFAVTRSWHFIVKIKNTAMKNWLLLASCWLWLYKSRLRFDSVTCHSHSIKSCWSTGSLVGGTGTTEHSFSWSSQISEQQWLARLQESSSSSVFL